MLRLDLQFYAFFVVVLSGAVVGLLFDLLRVARGYFRPNRWVGALGDLLFWAVATAALWGALFYGNWGELRLYVLVGVLAGLGLYYWLASAMVIYLAELLIGVMEWLVGLVIALFLRLVWAPLAWIAGLIWGAAVAVWRWLRHLIGWMGDLLADWLLAPLNGPYRWFRLHYLLTKRRIKRRLRHWLLGPPEHRRR